MRYVLPTAPNVCYKFPRVQQLVLFPQSCSSFSSPILTFLKK